MTFKDQVKWSWKWGAIAFLLAAFMLGSVWHRRDHFSIDAVFALLGRIGLTALAVSFALLVFGGVLRPAQRWFAFHMFDSTLLFRGMTFRQYLIRSWSAPFWRWWLHIDTNGNDLDA